MPLVDMSWVLYYYYYYYYNKGFQFCVLGPKALLVAVDGVALSHYMTRKIHLKYISV